MLDGFAFLRKTFLEALALGVGAPALMGACADPVGIEEDAGFVEVSCDANEQPLLLAGLVPAEPVDYLARGMASLDGRAFIVWEEVGVPCANAEDPPACLAALQASGGASTLMLREADWFGASDELRATRGNEVAIILSAEALSAFLGPIDSDADAVLLAAANHYTPTCTRSGSIAYEAGYEVQLFTHPGCDGRRRHLLDVSRAGRVLHSSSTLEKEPDSNCSVGRRPAGLIATIARGSLSVGAHFARCAELEAASVNAFESLEAELAAHAAPLGFRTRARAAAGDETRHARAVARLARRFGGNPSSPRVLPVGVRSLEALSLENAVEGCVRETYGVLVGMHQARFARDRGVRQLYAAITIDETRHAALAWDIARWAAARAGSCARRRTDVAMRHAVAALIDASDKPLPRALATTAGLPQPRTARRMLAHLQRTLWDAPLGI